MKAITREDANVVFARVATDAIYALRDADRHLRMAEKMLRESSAVRDHVGSVGLNPDSVADYIKQKHIAALQLKIHVEMQLFGTSYE